MKVQQLHLEQFAAFEGENTLEFCPGINVMIGANSTGKSIAMKSLYTLLKVCERAWRDKTQDPERLEEFAREKLTSVFKIAKLDRLARSQKRGQRASIGMRSDAGSFALQINPDHSMKVEFDILPVPPPVIFLPSHEFLTLYPGFIHAYAARETGFDETYYTTWRWP